MPCGRGTDSDSFAVNPEPVSVALSATLLTFSFGGDAFSPALMFLVTHRTI